MVPASAPLGRQLTSMTVLADIAGLAYRCWHGEDRKVWMLTTDTATATHPLLAVLPDSIVELDGVPLTREGQYTGHVKAVSPLVRTSFVASCKQC